ncbi:MAG: glutamyl-tRNA reductase [Opitutaceae bacterium]|nr:glutamyl-tRNA reductase [Opitutaceae bacterium]
MQTSTQLTPSGELFLVGATHRTAPLGLRERLALTAESEAVLAEQLGRMPALGEFVILNTCNRVEIYGVAETPAVRGRVAAAFCDLQGFARDDFARLRLDLAGPAAVQHLLEVASGLDSQMLGENEIFGQVKRAYATAQERGAAGPVLNRVFQKAFQAAKHVRASTAITAGLVSVANVAVDHAVRVFGDLSCARVLLLGAGEIGLKGGRAFRSRHPAALAVASRRLERAQEVAAELGATALAFDQALAGLGEYDVVVCSTSAPGTLISPQLAREAMGRRRGRPMLFIDVALPRDVEPGVAGLEAVFVCNLDDLARIAAENRQARQAEIAKCRQMLEHRTQSLWSHIDPMLRAVRPAGLPEAPPAWAPALPAT